MSVVNMHNELQQILFNPEYRQLMIKGYEEVSDRLGPVGAPRHAASEMVKILKK